MPVHKFSPPTPVVPTISQTFPKSISRQKDSLRPIGEFSYFRLFHKFLPLVHTREACNVTGLQLEAEHKVTQFIISVKGVVFPVLPQLHKIDMNKNKKAIPTFHNNPVSKAIVPDTRHLGEVRRVLRRVENFTL